MSLTILFPLTFGGNIIVDPETGEQVITAIPAGSVFVAIYRPVTMVFYVGRRSCW